VRRIQQSLQRLPKIHLGHPRLPDGVLAAGVLGAVVMVTAVPISQAFGVDSARPAAVASAQPAAAGDPGAQGAQAAHGDSETASRSAERAPAPVASTPAPAEQAPAPAPAPAPAAQAPAPAPAPAQKSYPNNLDGWIAEARDVLAAAGKPVPSAKAMRATAMAESSGKPNAVNGWDTNAKVGSPSIGLTQMIQPTFKAYALPGHKDIRNPVDNLIASSRYCDAKYGGMDKMAGARGYGAYWRGY